MAWAFDTKSVIADDAGSGTVNHTCGVTAKLLVVGIATTTTTRRIADGTAPTYGGVELTNTVTETDEGGEGTAELWYMIDPPTGQALPVVVNGTPNKTTMISSYTCAAGKTAALRTSNHAHTSGTNATVTLANTAGDLCVDSLFSGYTTPGTEAHTLLYEYDTGSESCASQYKLSGGTNQVMNYTTESDDYYIVAAAFYEVNQTPAIASLAPSETPEGVACADVVITGTGLGDVTAVTVGGHNATSFVVNRNTQITAQLPAHAYALDEHVVATNVTGSSAEAAGNHFDYYQDEISILRKDVGAYAEQVAMPWCHPETWTDVAAGLVTGTTYTYKAVRTVKGVASADSNEPTVAYSTAAAVVQNGMLMGVD